MFKKFFFSLCSISNPIYALPKSPETQIISSEIAPSLLEIFSSSLYPIAVHDIVKPDKEEVVSPPIKSTPCSSHAYFTPS